MSTALPPAEQPSIDYESHNLTQVEEMVNNDDVVPQRKWRQLKSSIVLGDYDVKVKFIPSAASPGNYKVDIIMNEENPNEEEVEIPPQYRERVHNWKMQMRKRSPSGRVEKFYYTKGVRKIFRTLPEVTSYILQGHILGKSSIKRKGEASTSRNEKKAKEEEIAEEHPSMKEYYDDFYNQLENCLGNKEEGHASSPIMNNIGGQQSGAGQVQNFLTISYNDLLRFLDD